MEIRILSAGKEIGPYSESQVRQYLSEGLISPSDPAIAEGMGEWQPTEQLLAGLTQRETAPETSSSVETSRESLRSVSIRATTLQRAKRGPITIQPIFSADGETPRRSRSGKTALTIEAPRPTTQLPPVAKFVPREERKAPKSIVAPEQIAPSQFFEHSAVAASAQGPTTVPDADGDIFSLDEPSPTPEPDVPPVEDASPESRALPRAIRYVSLVVGLVGLALLTAIVYVIWHFSLPAPHAAQVLPAAHDGSANSPAPAATPRTAADYSRRGYERQQKGDLDGALADYDQAVNLDPHNTEALYRRAVGRQTKGDWKGALSDYNALLAVAPDNADAYSNRGYVKQTLGDRDGALADYTEALTRKPTISEAFYNVGLIKVSRGDIDGGIEAFNKALDLNPKLARAYYNRGKAKNAEGRLEGAIADYTQAIELDPSNAMAYFNRGTARQSTGDTQGALADYTAAIADDANLAPAYNGRGQLEVQRGDFSAAAADCTRTLELDPRQAEPFFNRGLADLGLRTLDNAEADFTKYCEVAPHGADCDTARLYLWVVASQQNSRDKADDDLAYAVINSWNSSPEDLTSKIADFLVGHISEGELITDASAPETSLEPGRLCKVWYFAGIKRQVTGDAATALTYFQKSLATGQKDCCEYLFAQEQMSSLSQTRQASSQLSAPASSQ